MVSEFFFAAQENRSGNHNETVNNATGTKPGHLMTVDTQIERAWGAGNALLNFARFPNVVGTHWFQYCDEPRGGREGDGEDYNMGLIDTANRPYEELTESFRRLNAVLETIHKESDPPAEKASPGAENGGTVREARVPEEPHARSTSRTSRSSSGIRKTRCLPDFRSKPRTCLSEMFTLRGGRRDFICSACPIRSST